MKPPSSKLLAPHSKLLAGFLLCAVGVFCMAQTKTVVRYLRNLQDVNLPASPTTGHVLSYNGTLWTNAADATGTPAFNNNQFGSAGGTTNIVSGALVTNMHAKGLTNSFIRSTLTSGLSVYAADDELTPASLAGQILLTAQNVLTLTNRGGAVSIGGTSGVLINNADVGGNITNAALTASQAVFTDANKVLTSTGTSAALAASISDETGTGVLVFGTSPTFTTGAAVNGELTVESVILTNNLGAVLIGANPTNVVDLSVASHTNILDGALTIAHATNGVAGREFTHVRWFWPDGADRALTIPTNWKTNANSAVPANITNNWVTKMYVTSVGDTSTSANQTNVFVSFEFYK